MIKVENMHCSVSWTTREDAAELWAYAPIKSTKLGVTEDDKNNIGD